MLRRRERVAVQRCCSARLAENSPFSLRVAFGAGFCTWHWRFSSGSPRGPRPRRDAAGASSFGGTRAVSACLPVPLMFVFSVVWPVRREDHRGTPSLSCSVLPDGCPRTCGREIAVLSQGQGERRDLSGCSPLIPSSRLRGGKGPRATMSAGLGWDQTRPTPTSPAFPPTVLCSSCTGLLGLPRSLGR